MNLLKWIEQIILYLFIPLGLYLGIEKLRALTQGMSMVILFLPLIGSIMLLIVRYQYKIPWSSIFYVGSWKKEWKSIFTLFMIGVVLYSLVTWYYMPENFLKFPRENFRIWLMVMVFYPLFSVLPQGIIYRLYFFARYKNLYSHSFTLMVFSALYFCFAHIIFENFIALAFTFVGGFLFAWRYQRSQSLLISCLEHALYGNLLFTIGIGKFLVMGHQ